MSKPATLWRKGGFWVLFLLLVPTCQKTEKPRVVTTLPFMANLVKEFAGQFVEVESLYAPGENPFSALIPRETLQKRLEKASLLFTIGFPVDSELSSSFRKFRPSARVIITSDVKGNFGPPYVWVDPMNAQDFIDNFAIPIAKLLEESEASTLFQEADRLKSELNELTESILLKRTWAPRKEVYLFSPIFTYFVMRMGFKYSGSVVNSPSDALSEVAMEKARLEIRGASFPVLLIYSAYEDEKAVQKLARETGAHPLKLLLFPEEISPEARLIDLIRENMNLLLKANEAP